MVLKYFGHTHNCPMLPVGKADKFDEKVLENRGKRQKDKSYHLHMATCRVSASP